MDLHGMQKHHTQWATVQINTVNWGQKVVKFTRADTENSPRQGQNQQVRMKEALVRQARAAVD